MRQAGSCLVGVALAVGIVYMTVRGARRVLRWFLGIEDKDDWRNHAG